MADPLNPDDILNDFSITNPSADITPAASSAAWSFTGPSDVEEGETASYTLSLTGTVLAGDTATIDLIVTNIGTRFADYADLLTTMQNAIGLRDDLVYQNSLLTYTGDGSPMEDLIINLDIVDDDLSEDAEVFSVELTGAAGTGITIDPTRALVTTTIAASDQQSNGNTAVWSITGDTDVEEGGTASFTFSLAGTVLAGDTATVDLKFTNIDTKFTDFENPAAALQNAVALRDDLVYQNSLLVYTGDGSPMEDLVVNVVIADDDLSEDAEDFSVRLYDPAGTGVGIDPTSAIVTTTIAASDQASSAVWSITGDTDVQEGGTASYTLSLAGTVSAGDTATVDLILSNIDTRFADFADPEAAMQDAVALRSDLVYQNSLLTYTGDGSAMEDLVINLDIVNDTLSEGAEVFSVSLTGAAGAGITIDPTSALVTTTIAASDQGIAVAAVTTTTNESDQGAPDDAVMGTGGVDFLIGTEDGDLIFGLGGNDYLYGLSGNDLLDGGSGNDRLYGGRGADEFVLSSGGGVDTILGFEDGIDRIRLDGYDLDDVTIANRGSYTIVSAGDDAMRVLNFTGINITGDDFSFAIA